MKCWALQKGICRCLTPFESKTEANTKLFRHSLLIKEATVKYSWRAQTRAFSSQKFRNFERPWITDFIPEKFDFQWAVFATSGPSHPGRVRHQKREHVLGRVDASTQRNVFVSFLCWFIVKVRIGRTILRHYNTAAMCGSTVGTDFDPMGNLPSCLGGNGVSMLMDPSSMASFQQSTTSLQQHVMAMQSQQHYSGFGHAYMPTAAAAFTTLQHQATTHQSSAPPPSMSSVSLFNDPTAILPLVGGVNGVVNPATVQQRYPLYTASGSIFNSKLNK